MSTAAPPVRVERHGRVAVVVIDHPPVNALSDAVRRGLLQAMRALAADDAVAAVVISGGAGRFIAGADLREMERPPEPPLLPDLVASIDALPKPVIAALDGPALGGGLEIALACDGRLGSVRARLGLTETRLGLIPGAGGTQRLPRLVGVARAIEMIAGGSILSAQEALADGLLDAVEEDGMLQAAIARAPGLVKRRLSVLAVPAADQAVVERAAGQALKRAKGAPAIAEAVRVIRAAGDGSFAEGCARERAAFLALRESPMAAALRYLFLAEREAWKVPGLEGTAPRPISRAGVIGAGTMGAGIAIALADAGLPVLLVERDDAAATAGRERIRTAYQRQVETGRLSAADAALRLDRITATAAWHALAEADLVIEAAFEDLAVKSEIFARLDKIARPGAVLASNTSYLDLAAIAAATRRPQDVIGLHFFSPAHIMKLLEIVRPPDTAPEVLATALALARRLGKQPVVAGPCDGFIGNRIYAVYRRHAEYLVEDGAAPEQVDAALEAFGFAMGIFAVSDLSGLDIAHAMRQRRAATRDPAERTVAIADLLVRAGRLGRKTGGGWYGYDENGMKTSDPAVAALIAQERAARGITAREIGAEDIQRRLLAVMANEGAKLLAEGIALRSSDIDVAFVNGYGFPRGRGGPMWEADRRGLAAVLQDVEAAHASGGAGSEPAPLLLALAAQNRRLTDWRPGAGRPGDPS